MAAELSPFHEPAITDAATPFSPDRLQVAIREPTLHDYSRLVQMAVRIVERSPSSRIAAIEARFERAHQRALNIIEGLLDPLAP